MGSCLSHVSKNTLEVDAELIHDNGKRSTSPTQVALANKRHERQKKDRTPHDSELTKIKEENEALKQEIDILSTRLSAVASAKLTDGNLNIADLCDVNRPTKLAEQYLELYDNEWADAFDVLSKNEVPDEQACRMLLEIFCLVYETCLRKANDELHKVMDGINAFFGCQESPIEVMKSLKDQRKRHFREQFKQIKMLQVNTFS
ncbi:uncharacterized protein LOC132760246 [Ruditapes philippinarum]|uniref:uncharacterized protein LOC132760246 n=1 Tax=Ruditapes philippinarum TaxID=129788 RepID=UPI00295B5108|nr:uncharacterized protein LOC132760246 [Ruditapes philippinarum]